MLTKSKAQTQKIAIRLAKKIISEGVHKNARVLALIGDLGSGKTAFTQGFIKSLGIKTHVPSPTFVIFRRYPIHKEAGGFKNVFHFDLYRIEKPKEIIDLDFKKIIKNPENIVLIEWPEQILKFLPKNTIVLKLEHGKSANERIIKIAKN
ncbi:MAG: tRNA (adenosine(37)-N6)-threonylcarbamoyltransferase complex ATPase subunit type 1 TsaE [bacterium]|nr:tRNA (adenosine(37)-N6)-threonylcarbamoyltransferase complex ATPase subunit type 1 TsaE [bacterium]